MDTHSSSGFLLIKSVLWGAILFSFIGLVYNIRWFMPLLASEETPILANHQFQFISFIVQIGNNLIFLFIGGLLLKLIANYERTGYFDRESLTAFDGVIVSCISLALLGILQIVSTNMNELHFSEWTSIYGISNLVFRAFTRLLIFQNPQTIYFLVAIVLWAVKQFVAAALLVKNENESFV